MLSIQAIVRGCCSAIAQFAYRTFVYIEFPSFSMDFESEQRFHELEQRHISLKKEFEIVNIDKEALKCKTVYLMTLQYCASITSFISTLSQLKLHLSNPS